MFSQLFGHIHIVQCGNFYFVQPIVLVVLISQVSKNEISCILQADCDCWSIPHIIIIHLYNDINGVNGLDRWKAMYRILQSKIFF